MANFVVDRPGNVDLTFGSGGLTTTDDGSSYDTVRDMVLQPDGKIVVAGYVSNSDTSGILLARYNPDGSLDTTFGTGGKTLTTGYSVSSPALALQSDGKIVLAGYRYVNSTTGYDFLVLRYDASGRLDSSFGTGGAVTVDMGSASDTAYDVAIRPGTERSSWRGRRWSAPTTTTRWCV